MLTGKRLLLRCKPNLTSYIRNLNEKNINLVQYQWLKDNESVLFDSNTNLYKDGSLEIVKVEPHDTGFYRCIAKYRSITYKSHAAFINVVTESASTTTGQLTKPTSDKVSKQPPRFLLWPEDRNVVEDDEVVLECLALNDASFSHDLNTSAHQYYRYKWLKDGVALDLR